MGNEGNVILITGHSLGGCVAEIVASRLHADGYKNVLGFGLSPPGTLWNSRKFGYDFTDLDAATMTVMPRRDRVPKVDVQGGEVQFIECDAYKPWSCHSAIRSLCEVYHSCADTFAQAKNEAFFECLCVDLIDWNNCTTLAMTGQTAPQLIVSSEMSSALQIENRIDVKEEVVESDDHYRNYAVLVVVFAIFCFGMGVFISNLIQSSPQK